MLLQNEINGIPRLMHAARARGLSIVFNPAPMDPAVSDYPLELISTLIVNEGKATALVSPAEPSEMLGRHGRDPAARRGDGVTPTAQGVRA